MLFSRLPRMTVIALILSFIGACSTYTTNSDISFDSIKIEQKPEIFIGEEDFESFRLDYLGWMEAKVSRPTIFHSKPTKAQADVVLARLAKEKGAQGVFFVTYNWDVFGTLYAKGQAVRIHGVDQLTSYKEKLKIEKAREKSKKIAEYTDENNQDPAIFTNVENDPLVEAYMKANSVEDQIKNAGPDLVSLPRADVMVTLEQLRKIQSVALKNKDIVIYDAISELLNNLSIYE